MLAQCDLLPGGALQMSMVSTEFALTVLHIETVISLTDARFDIHCRSLL
jgi:hypothetical protein